MPRIPDREFEKRIRLTEQMLAGGHYPHQIKRAMSERFQVTRRTVDRWISVARARMQRESGLSRVDHKARVGATYREVLRQLQTLANDTNLTPRDKIQALRSIEQVASKEAKLYGLNEPEELRISGHDPMSEALQNDPDLVMEIEAERRKIFDVITDGGEEVPAVPDGVRVQDPRRNGTNGNGTTG